MININTNYKQLEDLRNYENKEEQNPQFYRIMGELRFLSSLSNSLGGKHDALITEAAGKLTALIAEKHCTTLEAVLEAENSLSSLAIFSLDKYGYRCSEDSIALTLLRSSMDPDPSPDIGGPFHSSCRPGVSGPLL